MMKVYRHQLCLADLIQQRYQYRDSLRICQQVMSSCEGSNDPASYINAAFYLLSCLLHMGNTQEIKRLIPLVLEKTWSGGKSYSKKDIARLKFQLGRAHCDEERV